MQKTPLPHKERSENAIHNRKTMRPYKCTECHVWHLTSMSANDIRLMKDRRLRLNKECKKCN